MKIVIIEVLSILILFMQISTLNETHKRFIFIKQLIKDDKKTFNVGKFSRNNYLGEWVSTNPSQGEYIKNVKGQFEMVVDYKPTVKPDQLEFMFIFYDGNFIENRNIFVETFLKLESDDQSTIKGHAEQIKIFKNDKIFNQDGTSKCTFDTQINLKDKSGNELPLKTDNIENIRIDGSIKSKDCKIDFTFTTKPKYITIIPMLIFMILQITSIVLSFYPLYKAIRQNDTQLISNISSLTFLGNILVDIILMTINISFAMWILINYFEFLTIISLFFMVSILFKIRFYLDLFEQDILARNLQENQLNKAKLIFLAKFIIAMVVAIILANFMIVHYYGFLIIFLYPICQILYNCYYVVKKHCFYFTIHFQFIVFPIVYPIAMRSSLFSFFKLKEDFVFIIVLCALMTFFMMILFFQKYFGRSFFMPSFLIPNYFNFYKKIKNLKDAPNISCPICFCPLTESPDDDSDSSLILKKYMQTPCQHQFHEKCLKQWMDQKLVCPYCRAKIPPY